MDSDDQSNSDSDASGGKYQWIMISHAFNPLFFTKILFMFCTFFFSQLSFYKAMADGGGHGFLDPLDYDPLDSDFAPDDEDKSK